MAHSRCKVIALYEMKKKSVPKNIDEIMSKGNNEVLLLTDCVGLVTIFYI